MSPTPVRNFFLHHFSFHNRMTFLWSTQVINVLRICNQSVDISFFFFLSFISSYHTADIKMTLSSYQLVELFSRIARTWWQFRFRSYHADAINLPTKIVGTVCRLTTIFFFVFRWEDFLSSVCFIQCSSSTFCIHSGWQHSPIRPFS